MPEQTNKSSSKSPTGPSETNSSSNVQKSVSSDSQGVYYNGVVCFVL